MNIRFPYLLGIITVCSWAIAAGAATSSAEAPEEPSSSQSGATKGQPSNWFTHVDGGYAHQFDTSLDEGGAFEVNRFAARAAVGYRLAPARSLALRLGYDRHHYHFNGNRGFGGADPWDAIHTLRVEAPVQWRIDERWMAFGLPSLRWNAEEGADWSQSLVGGGLFGVAYRFNERLTLGPGFGVLTEIEDSPNYFPVLLINWNISGSWWLSTDQGLGASQGPGVALTYAVSDQWSAFLGGRYEKYRFRLSESGRNPDGVGEDQGLPVYAGATFRWHRERSVSLIAGLKFDGEMTWDDSAGHKLADTDYDPSPFLGLSCDLKF